MAPQPILTIKDWQNGVTSPNLGFSKMRNVQLDENVGSVSPNYQTIQLNYSSDSITFTADDTTDICTTGSTVDWNQDGVAVTFTTTGTLPAGLSLATQYWLTPQTADTFKVATSVGGSFVNITDTGTGVHTVNVTAMGELLHQVTDSANDLIYLLDDNGRVWVDQGITFTKTTIRLFLLHGNTLTNASGNGLTLFTVSDNSAQYLFVFRNNAIDIFDVTTSAKRYDPVGTSSIANAWQTMNTGTTTNNSHHAIVGQDNIIYFCDDRYIGSIQEKPGSVFAPGTAATYTYNNQALDLIQNEKAWWLEELGTDLLVAGKTFNYVYPWNRRDNSFKLPLKTAEIGVYRLKNINDTVYIMAGRTGVVYATQGTTVYEVVRLSNYLTSGANSNYVDWGGVGVRRGNLLFGVDVGGNTSESGIYTLTQTPNGMALHMDIKLGGSGSGQRHNVITSYINTLRNGDFYRFGGEDGYYVFYDTTIATRFSSTEAVIETGQYSIATKTGKGKFSKIEAQLDRKPDNGFIIIKYRNNLYDTYTSLTTFTLANDTTSYQADVGTIDIENLQFEITPAGTGIQDGSVSLMEIRLYE